MEIENLLTPEEIDQLTEEQRIEYYNFAFANEIPVCEEADFDLPEFEA